MVSLALKNVLFHLVLGKVPGKSGGTYLRSCTPRSLDWGIDEYDYEIEKLRINGSNENDVETSDNESAEDESGDFVSIIF